MIVRTGFRIYLLVILVFCSMAGIRAGMAAPFIAEDGETNAEIVISRNDRRPRMLALAALELQYHLHEISGARPPIVTQPSGEFPVKIYVGESQYTEHLGITAEGLEHGAFRMVSGPDYLVLLGEDVDYTPQEPWARKRSDRSRALGEWDKLTEKVAGRKWGHPFSGTFKGWWNPKDYDNFMAEQYGADNRHVFNPRDLEWSRDYQGRGAGAGWWWSDRGGSLNAVYAFLRSLGTRWYMPREHGTVVPEQETIPLPSVDQTVRPDFAVRSIFWYNYSAFSFDDTIWARRIGLNSGMEVLRGGFAHGLVRVHQREEMKKAHPKYYALVGGKRDTKHRGYGTPCFSSDGFAQETVKFARFMYDQYDMPHISIWPGDGFRKCECDACKGKAPSELVWSFVDRVARELYKTHPDRLVSCGAYTPYIYPPESVDKFTPNVAVFIANAGRPGFDDPFRWKPYWERVQGWREKLASNRIVRNENNRYGLARKFPVLHPHAMAKDLHALKGISIGERGEQAQRKARWHSPGMDHLNLYVQSRFLWDADSDVEAVLTEYYDLFYGPAAGEMRKAFTWAENRYTEAGSLRRITVDDQVRYVEMLHKARRTAGRETEHGKRIQVLIDELPPLNKLRAEQKRQAAAGDPRQDAPVVVGHDLPHPQGLNTYRLKDLKTGEDVDVETTFTVGWDEDALVFDIRCEEPDMENLYITDNVWGGDSVALLLETPSHSYYQIEINPDGKVYDADRRYRKANKRWTAMAQVETERGEDYWRIKARIPVAAPTAEGAAMDPFHYVVGKKPSPDNPWFFNVGRVRIRDWDKSAYGFAATGKTYHNPDKFAKLTIE